MTKRSALSAIATALGILLLGSLPRPALAADPYVLAVDVPADLTGATVVPGQIALNQGNAYSVLLTAPEIGALQSPVGGLWYLSLAVPTKLGLVWVEPRDVISTDGLNVTVVLQGSAAGIPPYARIDALYVAPGGEIFLSFDVPAEIQGVWYDPAGVVQYTNGSFILAYSGPSRGVPAGTNIVGLDAGGSGTVLSFDIPVTLGATTFLPGSLVSDDGISFSLENLDPAWPPSAQLRDFSLAGGGGSVEGAGATPMEIAYDPVTGMITLSWAASCLPNDADFEVYEGAIPGGGPFAYSHAQKYCSTGGSTSATFQAPSGNAYYLVVPHNGVFEGSYGASSAGIERPQGSPSCTPQMVASTCQ